MSKKYHGVIPPILTPVDEEERVDEESFRRLIDRCIGGGLHGIFVAGTNGETMALTQTERNRAIQIAIDQAAGRVPVIKGKLVFNFVMGSQKLYDFCNRNPACELRTADYVNHPIVIAQNANMVSINSGIAVDFYGQVASDTIGSKQFSGVGGQVDFIRGTAMSTDGSRGSPI